MVFIFPFELELLLLEIGRGLYLYTFELNGRTGAFLEGGYTNLLPGVARYFYDANMSLLSWTYDYAT